METSTKHIFLIVATIVLVAKNGVLAQGNETDLVFLTDEELKKVDATSFSYVDRLTQVEEGLYAKGFRVKENSTLFAMAKFKQASNAVIDLSRASMQFTETIRILTNDFDLTEDEIRINMQNCTFGPGCLSDPVCPKSDKYRTIDGSCNSLVPKLRNLGRSVTGYRRLLKPAYGDGFSSPRRNGISGSVLPSPRLISTKVFSNADVPLKNVTHLLMQFGQLINHDMEFTSTFTFKNGEGFLCCGQNNTPLDPATLCSLVNCLPITVPVNDPQLQNSEEACMNFVRSSTGPNRISCYLPFVKYAEQLNQNSHWLDASVVYGSNDETMNNLRDPSSGLLRTFSLGGGGPLLPQNCSTGPCLFIAGDSRVNEQPGLALMHTIWFREHNRIAKMLAILNPTWSSETVFQETRRILIAELQHITYNEFLPSLLGISGMTRNIGLWPLPGSRTFSMISRTLISGPVSNEFAAAAFRMGHSLVQGTIQLYDASGKLSTYRMQDFFNNPSFLFSTTFIDNAIRGLVSQTSQTVDTQIVDDLRRNLFGGYMGSTSGGILDIVALNIQRGRDHGLPSYNRYRQYCGLPLLTGPISSLPTTKTIPGKVSDPIIPYFDPAVVRSLSSVYRSVDDIDLFVGGIAEINPLDDILIGPTFMCIIAENFKKVKFSDRYFYESAANPYPFSPDQLIQIKNSNMARILCDNDDGTVATMQPNAFFGSSGTNPKVNCSDMQSIPIVNLDFWKV